MDALKEYDIPFVGLKLGKHSFSYHIEDKFFTHFKYQDFKSIDGVVNLSFLKKNTLFELFFDIKANVILNCDTTNEVYEEKVDNTFSLIVKFGEEYNDDNDEVLILPHEAYKMNVAQYIYETIVLALPVKREHPGIKDGSLKSEILERLKELEIKKTQQTDPRWDKLNELLTSKKQ